MYDIIERAKALGYDSLNADLIQFELIKQWLDKEHNISISIETCFVDGIFKYELVIWDKFKDYSWTLPFSSYLDALGNGIRESLRLIKLNIKDD